MPRIELEISDRVYQQWQGFMHTQPAGRLVEAGLLGDWVCLGFMGEVNRYISEGIPRPQKETNIEEQSAQAAAARRKLTKPQKRVLPMFNENDRITVAEVSRMLAMPREETERMIHGWLAEGFLASGGQRDGEDTFIPSPTWQEHNLSANRPSLNAPRQPLILGKLPDEYRLKS